MSRRLHDLVSEMERRFPYATISLVRYQGKWTVGVTQPTPGNRSTSRDLADAIARLLKDGNRAEASS